MDESRVSNEIEKIMQLKWCSEKGKKRFVRFSKNFNLKQGGHREFVVRFLWIIQTEKV